MSPATKPGAALALSLLSDRLDFIEQYFDQRADVVGPGDGEFPTGTTRPNEAMQLLDDVRAVRSELMRLSREMEVKP